MKIFSFVFLVILNIFIFFNFPKLNKNSIIVNNQIIKKHLITFEKSLYLVSFDSLLSSKSLYFEKGEKLFSIHCLSCHEGRKNIILPEKDLQKLTLENLGINNINSLNYQIRNGKNGMPAFGGRLTKNEMDSISSFLTN